MSELVVAYRVQVFAYVDTEADEVTKVVVDDENIELPTPYVVETNDGTPVTNKKLIKKAIYIAEHAMWPAWENGF